MNDFWLILDTNFLMIPERWGVDIFDEFDRIINKKYRLVVPEAVLKELEQLKKHGNAEEKKAAKIGLELASKAEKIPSKMTADREILRLAGKMECVVATNDKELKNSLRKKGVPVIYLRQTSHLSIVGKI